MSAAEFPDALIEQAREAVLPYVSYRDDNFPHEAARAVLEAVAPAIRAQALRDAADQLRSEGTVLTAEGRRYCSHRLVEMADQINPKEATRG